MARALLPASGEDAPHPFWLALFLERRALERGLIPWFAIAAEADEHGDVGPQSLASDLFRERPLPRARARLESLGPEDDEGKSLGGERLFTSSIEGDWRVWDVWSLAVFADAGNVGKEDLFKDLPWSIGAGIRWYSPVGPIRLDLAFPQKGGNNFRLHISMGPDL